jgi:hypothetical protein
MSGITSCIMCRLSKMAASSGYRSVVVEVGLGGGAQGCAEPRQERGENENPAYDRRLSDPEASFVAPPWSPDRGWLPPAAKVRHGGHRR